MRSFVALLSLALLVGCAQASIRDDGRPVYDTQSVSCHPPRPYVCYDSLYLKYSQQCFSSSESVYTECCYDTFSNQFWTCGSGFICGSYNGNCMSTHSGVTLSVGGYVGIAIGGVIFVVILAIVIRVCRRRYYASYYTDGTTVVYGATPTYGTAYVAPQPTVYVGNTYGTGHHHHQHNTFTGPQGAVGGGVSTGPMGAAPGPMGSGYGQQPMGAK